MSLNLFFIASLVVFIPIVLALLLARGVALLDTAVVDAQTSLETEKNNYNPRLTAGHMIPVQADIATQLKEARQLAAKQAAQLPRGANMRIMSKDHVATKTAQDGVDIDPLTAVRIAAFHGWPGAIKGAKAMRQQATPAARTAAAPAAQPAKRDLEPGVDYEVIEITDDMSADEVRSARIANVKAKSAAMKAKKAAPATAAAAPSATPAAQPAAQPAGPTADSAGIAPPDLIEITDDMGADEVRSARIANAKANAAYKKALKAAGVDPSAGPAATARSPEAAVPAEPTPVTMEEPEAVTANIPKPDLVEITDDMGADEVRSARIANAKANAAYKKALKEAGIDPATVA